MYKADQTSQLFLPEKLLVTASAHEHAAMHRYRLLSLRFLPFNTGIARLLEALADESEQRLQALMQATKRLQLTERLPAEAPPHDTSSGTTGHHFFLIDDQAAATALVAAMLDERRALQLYRRLREGNGTPALDSLLAAFIDQSLRQCLVLEDCRDQLPLGPVPHPMQRRTA